MVEKVVSIQADATVKDAVDLMNQHDIGCLVVEENGLVEGIITERDILKRVVSMSKDARQTKVIEVLSKPLIAGGLPCMLKMLPDLCLRKILRSFLY